MIGTVLTVDGRTGVVIGCRPVAAPSRVRVLWQPLDALKVSEHDWPPTVASIVGVVDAKVKARTRRAPAGAPGPEPVEFSAWLGAHVRVAQEFGIGLQVPSAGTTRRAKLATTFARLEGEGYSLADFKLASLGVLADEFMRDGGHVTFENVLRVEKIGGRVDKGRLEEQRRVAAAAALVAGTERDWSRFDG